MYKRYAEKSCCGQERDLVFASKKRMGNKVIKLIFRVQKDGFKETVNFIISKLWFFVSRKAKRPGMNAVIEGKCAPTFDEVLNLQPGEMVEVRSLEEILPTLDGTGRYKGLRWMSSQQKYCGERVKVYKRLETMILESTREIRKAKNTVLLEGALCNGEDWYGCDRSCFFFWREAWLKRVEDKKEEEN
jgi:hypothetical protein